jgi:hypothetical protein
VLCLGPPDGWDPQRLSVGADMAFAGRGCQPTLTAWAPATQQDTLPDLAPDPANHGPFASPAFSAKIDAAP